MRAAISGPYARACADSSDRSAILRADTPNWAVLAYFDPYRNDDSAERRNAFDPRLAAAVQEAVMGDEPFGRRRAAFILADQRNAEAETALLKIHAQIKDQKIADDVAMAFFNTKNAEGRKRAQAACSRKPRDTMCAPDRPEYDGAPAEGEKAPAELVKARIAQLRDMGFAKVVNVDAANLTTEAAEVILLKAEHAHWFDVETGMYPNHHDSLLRRLAVLVAPALEEAVFDERAPEMDDESKPYELVAYLGGKRYSTLAQNLGDWYDLGSVLRLLNVIMQDRAAEARFHVLATADQTAVVVAAVPTAVAAAVKAGLFKLDDPGAAERVGKEFERQVLDSMQRNER